MTTTTMTAMFDRYADASNAVARLETAGIPHSDISIVSNDSTERARHADHADTSAGAKTGVTLGTAVGGGVGLLAGLGLLAIPGLGPVVAAGWLASTLLGAGLGAATGGAVGALTSAGVSEAHAHGYAEGIRRGGTLVTVRTDETRAETAGEILDDDGTVDMAEREASWRKEGWSGQYTDAEASDAGVARGSPGVMPPVTGGIGNASAGSPVSPRRVGTYSNL